MVPLNPSHRILFTLCICASFLRADVGAFYDPTSPLRPSLLESTFSIYLANDAISLKEFFADWHDDYHPRRGKNVALEDMRIDIGGNFYKDFYIGIFHKYNVFIAANRDFVDLCHTTKNKEDLTQDKTYILDFKIEGIRTSGLLLSGQKQLYHDKSQTIMVGASLSLMFGHDMQDGMIEGHAQALSAKNYQAEGISHYHYTKNYLYDLDVESANGIGYGSDLALSYENNLYNFSVKCIVNDLFSRIYWQDLPYSFVDIQTKNKDFDADGYVKYAPVISGVEKYRDFTQEIEARYKVFMEKRIYETFSLFAGVEQLYGETIPFCKLKTSLDTKQDVALSYESRFGSMGMEYRYKDVGIGLLMDDLLHCSAFALRTSFRYKF